jgi:transposase
MLKMPSACATENESIVSVGLDVHKESVQVCVLEATGRVLRNRRVTNDVTALVATIRGLGRVSGLALECGTGVAALADALIQATGWDVHLCHPGYVRRMRQNPDKTDLSDAHLLADLVRVGYLPRVWLAPPAVRDLRAAVRYRQQLVDRARNTKLRIRALLREHRVPDVPRSLWSQRGLAWLRTVPSLPPQAGWVLENHWDDLVPDTARLARATTRLKEVAAAEAWILGLLTQPGIGLVTACVMRAEIGYVGRFRTAKQLGRFCGVSPCNASSGNRQADAGLVHGCRRLLRDTLIEAAHRLSRHHPRWKAFKAQLKARGKAGSVIAAAIANRWTRSLFHQLRAVETAAPVAA